MSVVLLPDVSATDVDEGLVLLDQRHGGYWLLNRTGAASLRSLLAGSTPEEAAGRLVEKYPESAGRALEDVHSLLATLTEARLVVAS
ncbi:lasso peptide biosynthesis PqqD family chaperone [Umezawaea tangerina]|uniref:Coenzyme PQQ synthesis protein D (PqqD) n=1 Tax=Umezawaea tangerina TaxID=84725 RepID=A0A2T0T717_9PSEU|nr:lasso peptide biosynthesis PqqD family chaperone [Umezawaea tangerina]PRY41470.1 coenzyme PQQ synthesis protein D (PqqD) [Umezawaea tangerina]